MPRPSNTASARKQRPRFRRGARNTPMYLTPSVKAVKLTRTLFSTGISRAAADQGYAWAFSLNMLPSSTEISNLFARWRIDSVSLDFVLTAVSGSATSVQYPLLLIAVDYTDVAVPATYAEMLQRKHLELQFNSAVTKHVVRVQPRVNLGGVIQPKGFTSSDPTLEWFGVKAWIQNYNSTSADGRLALAETFHLTCLDEQ